MWVRIKVIGSKVIIIHWWSYSSSSAFMSKTGDIMTFILWPLNFCAIRNAFYAGFANFKLHPKQMKICTRLQTHHWEIKMNQVLPKCMENT